MSDAKKAQSNLELYPVRYTARYAKELVDHMSQGYSFASFAGHIGVSFTTLKKWIERYPEFRIAKEIGQSRSRFWWEQRGLKGLWKIDKQPQLNDKIWLANMRVRFGWRDQEIKPIDMATKDVATLLKDAERFIEQLKEKVTRDEPAAEDTPDTVD